MKVLPCPFCNRKPTLRLDHGWLFLFCNGHGHVAKSDPAFWHDGGFLTSEKGFWKNKSMAIKRTINSWNTRG